MKLCNYINIYKILHKIIGISQSLHKHYPSKTTGDKHRRASSAKLPQAVLAVCLSAAQASRGVWASAFLPLFFGQAKNRARGSELVRNLTNAIKGASSPLSHKLKKSYNYNQLHS